MTWNVTLGRPSRRTDACDDADSVDAVARAVTADALARQRQLVLTRLRRMGVDVIEAPYDKLGFAVIDRYLALRAQEAIAG